MIRTWALALAALITTAAPACSSEADPSNDDVVNVEVEGDRFTPASITIKVGQTVRWTWAGGAHNVVSGPDCGTEDGAFKSGSPVAGGTFDHKFEAAGTFPYYCTPHCQMGMTGEVIVE